MKNNSSESLLDLRFNGKLSAESNKLFNKISNDLRSDFNDLTEKIINNNNDNIDWWVNGVSTRNTYTNPFFHYFCCMHFVADNRNLEQLKVKKIVVDKKSIKKIIDAIIKKKKINRITVITDFSLRSSIRRQAKNYLGSFYLLLFNLMKLLIAKSIFKKQLSLKNNITLIDTFIVPSHTNSSRWYGSLWFNIPNKLKESTFFVYTIIHSSLFKLINIYSEIKKNKENFILKENHITISDILFAYNYRKRLKKIKINRINVLNQNISSMIKDIMQDPSNTLAAFEPLLTYRFISRLKKKNYKVRLAIDWFEGHSIDKAWNFGFKTFYPNTKTIAYRPYESYKLYLSSFPTTYECKSGVVPKIFAVHGIKTAQSVKEFSPNLKTILIPSYKFEHVWNDTDLRCDNIGNNVIVALPVSIDISNEIISLIIEVSKNLNSNLDVSFILKSHPTIPIKKFNFLESDFPSNVKFTNEKSFPVLLNSSKVLVTEGSSTCLESIAKGVPVILIKSKERIFQNPLPEGIDNSTYSICHSSNDIKNSLNKYFSMDLEQQKNIKNISSLIRDGYFQPITKEGTNIFLDTNKGLKYS